MKTRFIALKNLHKQGISLDELAGSGFECGLPIDGSDIPFFDRWVHWNRFRTNNGRWGRHTGYDFAAYLTTDGQCVLGLPERTPVRAVEAGRVLFKVARGDYFEQVVLTHDVQAGVCSDYGHLSSVVGMGDHVEKGQLLGHLYKDPGNSSGKLVHLHFGAATFEFYFFNPEALLPSITDLVARPLARPQFSVRGLHPQPSFKVAHFSKLYLNGERYGIPHERRYER